MPPATHQLSRVAIVLALFATGTVARAQDADTTARRPDAGDVCLGFAFGSFTPKLDWEKAGHRPVRDSSSLQHAPSGRDWAQDMELRRDSALYLFPSWWPVGVIVQLPNRTPAPGDTVSGTATALVARGDIEPPVARVKAWRGGCGAPPAAPHSSPRPSPPGATSAEKNPRKIRAGTGTRQVTPGILRRSP